MDVIFEGDVTQRTIPIDGAYSDSSFIAEFSMDTEPGVRRGYLTAIATISSIEAEVARVALVSGRTLAFKPPLEFGPISLRVQILQTEPLPQSLRVWRVDGAAVDGDSNGDERPQNLIELQPLPSADGIAIAPGRAIFEAGTVEKGWNGDRYGAYHDFERWQAFTTAAGFEAIHHYYRPPGLPREEQPWLASLWRRPVVSGR